MQPLTQCIDNSLVVSVGWGAAERNAWLPLRTCRQWHLRDQRGCSGEQEREATAKIRVRR
jgi:hypothetical protein